ncbi:primosomal protein N' [Gilvimarinus sp. F26214L]|uniref:primosomal protein N' n=1 Tax=Gilvimarinus sp. DZF01 TaxID=3461371 RepID=UPI00404539B7
MAIQHILNVAVPTPLRRTFDYLPPADVPASELETWQAGMRILVPFGPQKLVGVLLGISSSSSLSPAQLKPAIRNLDQQAPLPPDVMNLCRWAAGYYQHPVGEALATALPTLLRQGEAAAFPRESVWELSTEGRGLPLGALKRAPRQSAVLDLLHERGHLARSELKDLGVGTEVLRQLQTKGLVSVREATVEPEAISGDLLAQAPLQLNSEQQAALDQVRYEGYNTYLLEGATGSGKTEVYLQAIARVLEQGRSALVLVPEIGLTPQLVGRFRRRFRVRIAALHSGLNDRERLQGWLEARHGHARIVIGTRSAVFTPIPRLGMIIIDEEHDLSFKQQDGFRYSARDLSVVRAQRSRIPLLLGSATPSLESLYNASHQRYLHLRLTQRAGAARPPEVALIDLRGQALSEGFSAQLLAQIEGELEKGNQALVFINRRGFAPALICHDCGWIADCKNCSAKLTVHQYPPHLHCHHCDFQRPVPHTCPDCFSKDLEYRGQGTERSEAFLQQTFPDYPVIRVDRDTTRRKQALQGMLAKVQEGQPCILVGTQMLAKGHHFPDVTLVAMIDIDGALFSGDFRGPERMGQLLIQVAGRAGRANKPGRVIIQSHHCEHPNIQSLIKEGYHRYARRLLHERQLAGLPPYRYLALIRAESKRAENASDFLAAARQVAQRLFPPSRQLSYLGPLPALMERKKDRYCFQLHINSEDRRLLHQVVKAICEQMENHALSRRSRWSVDVDPQDMA